MSADRLHPEFERWLTAAVRSVPADARQQVRAELLAHYADALSDYRTQGVGDAAAHAAAMRDLGDVRATAELMQSTHAPRGRYLYAALLTLAPAVCGFASATMISVDLSSLHNLAALIASLYVLNTFARLLAETHWRPQVDPALWLIRIGLLALIIPSLLAAWLPGSSDYPAVYLINDPLIFGPAKLRALLGLDHSFGALEAYMLLATLILAGGWIWLGERLLRTRQIALAKPVGVLLLITSIGMLAPEFAYLVEGSSLPQSFLLAAVISGTVKQVACALLFLRAAAQRQRISVVSA